MNTKPTALILAAAAALLAFILLVEQPIRRAALIPPNRRVLPNLDPARITAVEVQAPGGVIRAEQTNHLWRLAKPVSYPADTARIGRLLQELAQWEWQSSIGPDELTNRPNAAEEFGFVAPQFTLVLQENGRERVLQVGQNTAPGDEVYLNVRGSYLFYVASADLLQWIPTDKDQWRDLTVLDLARTPFQKIEVRSTNSSFDHPLTLEFDAASHLWMMTSPLQVRADTPKIAELLAQLQALRVRRFVHDDPAELDLSGVQDPTQTSQLKLTFLNGTNLALELQMGASPTNNTNLAYARRQQPADVIEIARDTLLPWEGGYTNFLDRHLTSLSPALIESIGVEGAGYAPFTVQKTTNGSWRVAGDETFVADEMLMKLWLSAFTNIEVGIERTVEADPASYGLDQPATPLLHYKLYYATEAGQTNQIVTDLLFGAGTNQAGKIYERRKGELSVNTIAPEQFERLPRAAWELRDRSIWHFESNQVAAIDVHQRGGHRRFIRDPQNQWTLAPGSRGLVIPSAIEEALYRLGRLQAVYWSDGGADHLERYGFGEADFQIALEVKKGGQMETNILQFGRPSPHLHPYASVVRDGRRLVFEFPIDLFAGYVTEYLWIPPAGPQPR